MSNNIYDVAVVGGGAAGLVAAISAARNGATVLVLEKNDFVGKKIYATGNGRCNFANKMQGVSNYNCKDPAFVASVFEQFGLEDVMNFFASVGLIFYEKDGYYYPQSNQAYSVVFCLQRECERLNITVVTDCNVRGISFLDSLFLIQSKTTKYYAKCSILCCGGQAAPKTGSSGDGYYYAKQFGHTITPLYPGLVGLHIADDIHLLKKIRANVGVVTEQLCEIGEVQFHEDYLSGIPILQCSGTVAKALQKKEKVPLFIDFLPHMSKEELLKYLKNLGKDLPTTPKDLTGLFPVEVAEYLLKKAAPKDISSFIKACKETKIFADDTLGFKKAQITVGGISVSEVKGHSLESRLQDNLFFAGEILDVDGRCGGYNLQFAWATGFLAGEHAARRCYDTNSTN